MAALAKAQNASQIMPPSTANDVCWRYYKMVWAPDGEAPVSAYRATVDIFVEIGGIMFLAPPAPCNGIAVPRATPDRWGYVFEPISDRDPGAEPHYLKISKYMFHEMVFVRTHYVDNMMSKRICPWVTLPPELGRTHGLSPSAGVPGRR